MKITMTRFLVTGIALLALSLSARADVKLPHIFGNHMVVQQNKPIAVWGTASPGEAITVTFGKDSAKTTADAAGKWSVRLKPVRAIEKQAGQTLTVAGKNSITFQDVLVGEVWICSGQSNMQMAVGGSNRAQEEIAAANFPNIRLFTVPDVPSATPQDDCNGEWQLCSPSIVGGFSGVGFFFGRHLHEQLKVPVGLIHTSWGGTIAEAWTSAPALRAKLPEFNAALDALTHATDSTAAQQTYEQKLEARRKATDQMYTMEDDITTASKTAAVDFDDHAWKTMKTPGTWESQGMADLDGIVWFRKTIDVPAAWAGQEIILHLGPIDEVDNTWFNGTLVGGKGNERKHDTGFWDKPRDYHVPGSLVKAGANVIAIRVFDGLGAGGLAGSPAAAMFAERADGTDSMHVSLAGDWHYFPELILPLAPQPFNSPNVPSVLFNAMINPLIPFGIQGAIWYQGESNAGNPTQYRTLLPTLIRDWRQRWGEGDFTFLIVSLANYMPRVPAPQESNWAELREAQALTAATLPKTGVAIAIDIGDGADIHPRNKQDVGLRLALAARAIAYNEKIAYSGPTFKAMTVKGNKAELSFHHTDKGLVAKGDSLKGFAICGSDRKFVWAQAKIDGDKVIAWADEVAQPVAVRYAWANNPECNLYNGADLPAVPFRTDQP